MAADLRAVFVFSRDPLPGIYTSLADAADEMDATDVRRREYPALYTLDGRVIRAIPGDRELVELEVTSVQDMDGLRARVRACAADLALKSDPGDLVEVANELLRDAWEGRSPKRPKWLARRLHGDPPTQI